MKKKFDEHLIILVIIILLSGYIRLVNLNQPIWPDEALYAKTAENLYNGKGFTFDGTPWSHQPPFFVLLLTFSYLILGVSEASARIVGQLFGILGVIAVYYLGKYLYNEKVGTIAAFFLGVTPVHWFLSRMILADIVLTTLITLTILFFLLATEKDKRYTFVASILIALVCITKRVGPIIYLILGAYLIASERNLGWIKREEIQKIFGISLLLQIPLYLMKYDILMRFSTIYTGYVSDLSTPNPQGISTVLKVLPYTVSKPVLLLFPLGIFYVAKRKKKEDILTLTPVFIFLFVFMLWEGTWIEAPRYLLPTVPFFCIISAVGIHNFSEKLEKKSFYTFFIITLLLFTVVVNADQGMEMSAIEWGRYEGYNGISQWIDRNTAQDSIILSNSRIIRYYSDRNLIYYPPEEGGFKKYIDETASDIYLVIDGKNRISPLYTTGYIRDYQGSINKVATFEIGLASSKVEIYSVEKE